MRFLLAFIFALFALSVRGASFVTPNVPASSSMRYIVAGTSAAEITNAFGSASPGTTFVIAGGDYIIPTNNTSWLRPGVNYYFEPGARFFCGHPSDSTIRPWFVDTVATTNFVGGDGFLVFSNTAVTGLGGFLLVTNPASDVSFECNTLDRRGGVGPTIHQWSGSLVWRIKKLLRSAEYDAYWAAPHGNGLKVNGHAERIVAGDSGIEFSGTDGAVLPGNATISWGTMSQDPDPAILFATSLLDVNATVALRGQQIFMPRGGFLQLRATGSNIVTLDCPIIESQFADFNENVNPLQIEGNTRIIGASINSVSNGAPVSVSAASVLDLVNCKLRMAASTTLNFSAPGGDVNVNISGTLDIDRPIAVNAPVVSLSGGRTTGPPLTNNFSGTNVFVDIGGPTFQALDVTNAMLLILTNSTKIKSGKETFLTLYNNKATNMNVAYSAASFRPMNQVQNTVTNGRSLVLHILRQGTNNQIMAFQQQN